MENGQMQEAIEKESRNFRHCYLWLRKHMPPAFFKEVSEELLNLATHSLIGFNLQQYFSQLQLKHQAIVLSLDTPEADVRILKNYNLYGIRTYRSFISTCPPPISGVEANLRITLISFTEIDEGKPDGSLQEIAHLKQELLLRHPRFREEEIDTLITRAHLLFIHSLPVDLLVSALAMLLRAKTRDACQYEVIYNRERRLDQPSMRVVLAWRNTPKQFFLYQIAKVIFKHNLVIKSANATYVDAYHKDSVLMMALELNGINGQAAWEVADTDDFIQELVTIKYFFTIDNIEELFVDSRLLRGNLGHFLRALLDFVHQALVQADIHLYTLSNCEEALCRHPELTILLCQAFELKFHPLTHDLKAYQRLKEQFLHLVDQLDTGHETNDSRRRNVLTQGMNFIENTLKTNFYQKNRTSLSFRLDPSYLDHLPIDRKARFPLLPYGIFFIRNADFFGFHIRFKDLARGGVRTIIPEHQERALVERNSLFVECYNLAYTQQKKNKDIPEGGAKAVIFLQPFSRLNAEIKILTQEMHDAEVSEEELLKKVHQFKQEQKLEYLYQNQRSFISSLMTLINCDKEGKLKADQVIDYWQKAEYLYLGPDENMHDSMIEWIAAFSRRVGYKPGSAFISGKPSLGINHKHYGVTSLGVNVYMEEVLRDLNIYPDKERFTLKIAGGPDGDVAGNEICNLYRFYPQTAKILALTDVSGTIQDPLGLDLKELFKLFQESKPIRFYSPDKLNEGGFLLDLHTKREETIYAQQTLCWRKKEGRLEQEWLSGNEMNALYRSNVHQTKVDIFIPAGGRPRTLNENNYQEFLDPEGKPTARAIVEGANLYLTQPARRALETLGTLIIKDSSANKTGVICSSFEVLCGLTLKDEEFLAHRERLIKEILEVLRTLARAEARLLLNTYHETGQYLTAISEEISDRINTFTDQLLSYLEPLSLSTDPSDPLTHCFLSYTLPLLRNEFSKRLLDEVPESHKKAIIACYIAAKLVYQRGLSWSPTLVDVLPLVLSELN